MYSDKNPHNIIDELCNLEDIPIEVNEYTPLEYANWMSDKLFYKLVQYILE